MMTAFKQEVASKFAKSPIIKVCGQDQKHFFLLQLEFGTNASIFLNQSNININ